ncbi:MAG: branched-chain amino acid ABC transporter permease [Gammaproteobacteria bacterium]|nr:branched-chain amino acid ABC transporter permease [Gammaproteobacteria bacterium]
MLRLLWATMTELSREEAYRRGVRDILPAAPGIIAWALVTGVAMIKSGLTIQQATGLSLAAYAGSAQLAALPLIISGAPLWLITLTAIVVNLRFVVYSAMTRRHLSQEPWFTRLWLAYLVADIMFVRFTTLLTQEPNYPHISAYYLGAAICNWVIWQVGSIAGIWAGSLIPSNWGLELAGSLALVALVVPLCRYQPTLVGVLIASLVSFIAYSLPLKLGLLLGVISGMSAALLAESVKPASRQH